MTVFTVKEFSNMEKVILYFISLSPTPVSKHVLLTIPLAAPVDVVKSLLKRMAKQGLIKGSYQPGTNPGDTIAYRLTEKGEKILNQHTLSVS